MAEGVQQADGQPDDRLRLEQQVADLQRALESRTTIGIAMGILMVESGTTAEKAFDILRRASQRKNRKLRDVAADIVAAHDKDKPPGNPRPRRSPAGDGAAEHASD